MNDWLAFEEAVLDYTRDITDRAAATGPQRVIQNRWRRMNSFFEYASGTSYWVSQDVSLAAFQTPPFLKVQKLSQFSPLKEHLNEPIGGSIGKRALYLQDFLMGTLSRAVRTSSNSIVLDEKVVRDRIQELRSLCENPTLDVSIVALLDNFALNDGVQLSKSICIRLLSDEEVESFLYSNVIPVAFEHGQSPRVQVPQYGFPAVEVRIAIEKEVGHGPISSAPIDSIKTINPVFERLADGVALIDKSRPILLGWRTHFANSVIGGMELPHRASSARGERSALLSSPGSVAEIYRRMDEVDKSSVGVRLATRRLGFAVDRQSLEDRLLDSMIALEALLLNDMTKERGELRFRLALRAAQFWMTFSKEPEAEYVYDLIRNSYDRRSAIAHGSSIDLSKTARIGIRALTFEQLVDETQEVARRCALEATRLVQVHHKYEVPWDTMLRATLRTSDMET